MTLELILENLRKLYEVHEWKHACAILKNDFPAEWKDIIEVLSAFRLHKTDIKTPGGGKSPISNKLDGGFFKRGWVEKAFDTKVVVDKKSRENPTHKIDCYKNQIALEVEWNNKDPFYDRDLNNFRILTTHMSKLLPRIEGGGGGGCPIAVFGIKDKLYLNDK